jgi:hypothetical protein
VLASIGALDPPLELLEEPDDEPDGPVEPASLVVVGAAPSSGPCVPLP